MANTTESNVVAIKGFESYGVTIDGAVRNLKTGKALKVFDGRVKLSRDGKKHNLIMKDLVSIAFPALRPKKATGLISDDEKAELAGKALSISRKELDDLHISRVRVVAKALGVKCFQVSKDKIIAGIIQAQKEAA